MERKRCTQCNNEKPLSEFYKLNEQKHPGKYRSYCKECSKHNYKHLHYQANKKYYKTKVKERLKDIQEWFREYKKNLICCMCGDSTPWHLSFHHHNNDKEDTVSSLVCGGAGKDKILDEINKCVVVCHNCHSDIHRREEYL